MAHELTHRYLEQFALLRSDVRQWNAWRNAHPEIEPHLYAADLRMTNLSQAVLSQADLSGADLCGVQLSGANLTWADLTWADLTWADLTWADLTGADLTGADLTGADLIDMSLINAKLDGCHIFGISAWKVQLDGATQTNLCFTDHNEPAITVDDLRVAQFLYLLLNNQEIRAVLDTVASKVVLILGRFSEKRKPALDALRVALERDHWAQTVHTYWALTQEQPTRLATLDASLCAQWRRPCRVLDGCRVGVRSALGGGAHTGIGRIGSVWVAHRGATTRALPRRIPVACATCDLNRLPEDAWYRNVRT